MRSIDDIEQRGEEEEWKESVRAGGAAPPIIKLACCVEGPCLWGRRGSFLHSVDSSEREEGGSELSLCSLGLFLQLILCCAATGDLHTEAD